MPALNPQSYCGNKLKQKYDPIVEERFKTDEVKIKGNYSKKVKAYIGLVIILKVNFRLFAWCSISKIS